MIYLLMLIPICFLLVMFFKQIKPNFSNKIHFLIGGVICLLISWATIYGINKKSYWDKVKDTEWLSSYITKIEHYEAWDEKVSCRHPIYVTKTRRVSYTTGSGKNKTTGYRTETYRVKVGNYHPFDVDEHGEQFLYTTNVNKTFGCSSTDYFKLRELWNNEKKVDLGRNYYSKDGDKLVCFYDYKIDHTINLVVEHEYENKVRVSNSIYTYQKVDSSDLKRVYNYPTLGGSFVDFNNFPCVLSKDKGLSNISYANQLLQSYNSLQGVKKQIKYWLCLFPDMPVETAFIQEANWEGGNKNEFVTCIGYDSKSKKINWVKPFAWDNEVLKQTIKDSLCSGDSLDLVKAVKVIANNGNKNFARKPFAEFSYLNVSYISLWDVSIISIIMLIVCVIFFFINLKMEE